MIIANPPHLRARDIKIKQGTFTWTTAVATSQISVTGLGFRPKAIMFISSGGTADSVNGATSGLSMGYAVSSSERYCITTYAQDAVGTSNTLRKLSTDAISQGTNSTSLDRSLDFLSMDADGFTVIVDTATPNARLISYLAFGGSDLKSVSTGTFQEAASTGTLDVTTPGFRPDLVLFSFNSASNTTLTSDASMGFGAMNGSEQFSGSGVWPDNQASTAQYHWLRYDHVISNIPQGGALVCRASFSAWLSNGFQLNFGARDSTRQFGHLSMRGIRSKIGSMSTRTDGTNISVTGVGFRPKGIIFFCLGKDQSAGNSSISGWDGYAFGLVSGPSNRSTHGLRSRDAQSTTDIANAVDTDEALLRISTASTNIESFMDIVSFDADGFTCVMDDVDDSLTNVMYIALG